MTSPPNHEEDRLYIPSMRQQQTRTKSMKGSQKEPNGERPSNVLAVSSQDLKERVPCRLGAGGGSRRDPQLSFDIIRSEEGWGPKLHTW
jgi:hypothetical protein